MDKIAKKFPGGLYLVANYTKSQDAQFLWCLEEALRGGIDMVQLRAKELDYRAFYVLAKTVLERCRDFDRPLIINDNVEIAKELGACGIHLGPCDTDLRDARENLGSNSLIGYSLVNKQEIPEPGLLDYLAVSPVFATKTKSDATKPYGLTGLASVVKKAFYPVVAIGGISIDNAGLVLQTGCTAIAVVSAIMNAKSPYDETVRLREVVASYA